MRSLIPESPTPSQARDVATRGRRGTRVPAFLKRLLAHRMAMVGAAITLTLTAMSIVGPLFAQKDPLTFDLIRILSPPSLESPFGTDEFGRDVFSRVMHGSRLSLTVGAFVLLTTSILGTVVGLVSGYFRRLDGIIMRAIDALMAFPSILLALVIATVLGPRTINVVIALTLVYFPRVARLIRGTVLAVRDQDFVTGGVAVGASDWRLILRYILPSAVAPLIVQATFIYAYAVLGEASLSFLGVGTPPPTPSLGNIINDARPMLREAPWMALFPGVAIALTVFGFNLLGDGLRDVFDPKAHK